MKFPTRMTVVAVIGEVPSRWVNRVGPVDLNPGGVQDHQPDRALDDAPRDSKPALVADGQQSEDRVVAEVSTDSPL